MFSLPKKLFQERIKFELNAFRGNITNECNLQGYLDIKHCREKMHLIPGSRFRRSIHCVDILCGIILTALGQSKRSCMQSWEDKQLMPSFRYIADWPQTKIVISILGKYRVFFCRKNIPKRKEVADNKERKNITQKVYSKVVQPKKSRDKAGNAEERRLLESKRNVHTEKEYWKKTNSEGAKKN